MKVIWLEQADRALYLTADYIAVEYGQQAMKRFMSKVDEVGILLEDNPYLGPEEPLLTGRTSVYRSVVVAKVNKIVYRIVNDRIEIADFWDVRREPQSLAKQVG